MKRSEALKHIANYLDINAGLLVPEQVLNVCEGLGMQPPALPNQQYIDNCDNIFYTYQWEEE